MQLRRVGEARGDQQVAVGQPAGQRRATRFQVALQPALLVAGGLGDAVIDQRAAFDTPRRGLGGHCRGKQGEAECQRERKQAGAQAVPVQGHHREIVTAVDSHKA